MHCLFINFGGKQRQTPPPLPPPEQLQHAQHSPSACAALLHRPRASEGFDPSCSMATMMDLASMTPAALAAAAITAAARAEARQQKMRREPIVVVM
jgi:hypothetical protein